MQFDCKIEFNVGLRDAEKDISLHGLKYAKRLISGQDVNDPYIKGYTAYMYDYIDKYGDWEQ